MAHILDVLKDRVLLCDGGMGASVVMGYPGSLASLWQEFGRAGRRQEASLSVLVASSNPLDQFVAAAAPLLDIDRFIRGYAIDALTYHWDGYAYNTNNHYIYDDPGSGKFVFIPHGMDQLFQNIGFDPFSSPIGRLAQRARELPALDAKFRQEIAGVLAAAWDTDVLFARIDQLAAILHSAELGDERSLADLASFDATVQSTRDFLLARKANLSQ